MPRVSIDLSEAQSRKPIPDGEYHTVIEKVTGPHKGPKSIYLTAELKIDEGDFAGRKFFHNLPIEKAGAGITADFVSKVTGEDIDVDELEEMELDTDELIGAPVGIVTKQEEYPENSGEMRSQIKKILRAR